MPHNAESTTDASEQLVAPPTNKPRLALLDPEQVALSAAEAMREHVARLVASLEPGWSLKAPKKGDALRETPLYQTVHTLGRYAVSGEPLERPVQDYLAELVILHAATIEPAAPTTVEELGRADPTTPLGLVLCAAVAREKVDRGKEVLSAVEVGALAGLDPVQIRTLAHAGDLPGAEQLGEGQRRPFVFAPKPLRKWLRGRAVAGF